MRDRPRSSTCLPSLDRIRTDDGSFTLIDNQTGVTFHSQSGAATETRHVYLENSGVAARLSAGTPTAVLEIGFGTGMAFAQSADAALATGTTLRYVGYDTRLLPAELLESLEPIGWGISAANASEFLALYRRLPLQETTSHEYTLDWQMVGLALRRGDVGDLQHLKDSLAGQPFDAVYFDPFAPAAAAELWSVDLLRLLHGVLNPNGRLVTYCVGRPVREAMVAAGFDIARVAGPPGGKREVLVARV